MSLSFVFLEGERREREKPKTESLTLRELENEVSPDIRPKWQPLGLQLRLSYPLLKGIQKNNTQDCAACCREMFHEWIIRDEEVSWNSLITALGSKAVNEKKLARKLSQYGVCSSSSSSSFPIEKNWHVQWLHFPNEKLVAIFLLTLLLLVVLIVITPSYTSYCTLFS